MAIPQGRLKTLQDIRALPEGERAELIDGRMYAMPSPKGSHQGLITELITDIKNHIRARGGPCEVYLAPFAVFLKEDGLNYLEPDIIVVCDPGKLDEEGCHGAPDWVIEIASPASYSQDYIRKLNAYQDACVREYWVVDPPKGKVTVFRFELDGEEGFMREFPLSEAVASGALPGLSIDFAAAMAALK
jgi:Uma2 family endonuclease